MEEDYLSLSEVAEIMAVHPKTVRRWIKSGKLRAYKPGRDYRIPKDSLRAFHEASEAYPKFQAPLPLDDDENYQPPNFTPEQYKLMGENLRFPEAAGLCIAIDETAITTERTIERGSYSLEAIHDLKVMAEENYHYFLIARRRWMKPDAAPASIQERLQEAMQRLKAARKAAREAYRIRLEEAIREEDTEALKVVELQDRERRNRNHFSDAG